MLWEGFRHDLIDTQGDSAFIVEQTDVWKEHLVKEDFIYHNYKFDSMSEKIVDITQTSDVLHFEELW